MVLEALLGSEGGVSSQLLRLGVAFNPEDAALWKRQTIAIE